MSRLLIGCLAPMLVAFCCGCASPLVSSVPVAEGEISEGLAYSLAKGQVRIQASRRQVADKDVEAARKTAAAALESVGVAEKAVAEARAAHARAQANLAAAEAGGDATVRQNLAYEQVLAATLLRARSAELDVAKLRSKEATKRADDLSRNVGRWEQTVTLSALKPVPDRQAQLVATWRSSNVRDDNLKLTVVNGLLTGGSSESIGQVPAILTSLLTIGPSYRSSSKPMLLGERIEKAPECEPYSATVIFDPTERGSVAEAAEKLKEKTKGSLLLVEPQLPRLRKPPTRAEGLIYRPLVPVTVEVAAQSIPACGDPGPDSQASLTGVFPDASQFMLVKLRGSALTRTKHNVVFNDGTPTELSVEQPSQLAAVARIPVDIAKAIVEIPASIVKLRVDYDNQAAALVEAQSKKVEAEIDLLRAQQELETARNDVEPGLSPASDGSLP